MDIKAVAGAIVVMWFVPDADFWGRFLPPLMSGIAFYFIRIMLDRLREKYKNRKSK